MKTIVLVLLVCVGMANAQMLHYADSTASLATRQGLATSGAYLTTTRAVGSISAFNTYWWGPYDISDCWGDPNIPGVSTQADTMIFRGYMSGVVDYAESDTVLGRWKAYLSVYPYPPQIYSGTTTYPFNWNNADSLISYKVRAASDFVTTVRDGYPMYSAFSIATVASDTITYPYLFMVLELDSSTGTPAAGAGPLEYRGYWTYDCLSRVR